VKDLHLHPRDFGVHMRKRIEHKLISEMEGTCTVKCGLVIAITSIDEVEQVRHAD
jgi:DNA-directed RNA polymerase subunit E'/Rpb7